MAQFRAQPNVKYYNASGQVVSYTSSQLNDPATGWLSSDWSTTQPTTGGGTTGGTTGGGGTPMTDQQIKDRQTQGIKYVTIYRPNINGQIESTKIQESEVPNYTAQGWNQNYSYWTPQAIEREKQIQIAQQRGESRQAAESRVGATPGEAASTSTDKIFQMADGRWYNATTGKSGTTKEEVTTPAAPVTPPGGTTGGTTEGTGISDAEKQKFKDWLSKTNYSDGQKAILWEMFINSDNYTSGDQIPSGTQLEDIIKKAGEAAEANLKPYYETLTGNDLEDLKATMENIRTTAELGGETAQMNYNQTLASTKQALAATGRTFSGLATKQLGAQGALPSQGIEGTVPATARISYAEQLNTWQNQARQVGVTAERALGSEAVSGITGTFSTPEFYKRTSGTTTQNLYNPVGNVPIGGSIEEQRRKAIEEAKWRNVQQYRPFT